MMRRGLSFRGAAFTNRHPTLPSYYLQSRAFHDKHQGSHSPSSKHGWTVSVKHGVPELVDKIGLDIANESLFNKGSAFPMHERDQLRLRGLLPPRVCPIELQSKRVMEGYNAQQSDIARHDFLSALHDRNETLFYKVLLDNIKSMCQIVYTPTVGKVCQKFGHLFRKRRGMYFSTADRGLFSSMVYNWPGDEMDIIVVTDGGRILGLGDLGANGMGIPIGKSALYVAAGGINPARILPVVLDVGTDNEALLNDPLYLGLPHRRLKGPEYWAVIDEFMHAVKNRWPNVCVQFEDFNSTYASDILNKYRHKFLSFNDDIQGTGAVILAGAINALRLSGQPVTAMADQRILIAGAGSAGIGVASAILHGMVTHHFMQNPGSSKSPAEVAESFRKCFWLFDAQGMLNEGRTDLTAEQKEWARKDQPWVGSSAQSVADYVRKVKPTMLFGMSTVGGLFNEDSIREMAKHVDRPIIFPLSNPTVKSECTAQQAYTWTDGRGIFASGSPFDPVEYKGKTFIPTQGNNMFIFPGVGMGAVSVKARKISDSMFFSAAMAVANYSDEKALAEGRVYPDISEIRKVSYAVSKAVAQTAIDEGLARDVPDDLDEELKDAIWDPEYSPLVAV